MGSTGPMWTRAEGGSVFTDVLAVHYRKWNYDKTYLFYKEFLQRHPEDVPAPDLLCRNGDDAGKGERCQNL